MATPARRLILEDLVETLEGIDGSDTKIGVQTVELLAKTWAQVPGAQRPWIGVMPGVETFAFQPGQCIRVVFDISLVCHVEEDKDQDRQVEDLNDLLDDVIATLQTDTTRGGNAVMTTVTTVATDEGAPEGGASMVIGLQVVYFRSQGAS